MSVASIPRHVRAQESASERNQPCLARFRRRELADVKSSDLWRGACAECAGCFMVMVMTVGVGSAPPGQEPPLVQVALGVGFTLAAVITAFTKVSGGHVNPAISLGFLITGEITYCRFLIYCMFQTAGGILGSAFLQQVLPDHLMGNLGLIQPHPGATTAQAVAAEAIITFMLLFVTMSMVDKGRTDVGGSIPFMVGTIVTVNVLFGAHISGGCMNPMRNFGPAVILGKYDNIWIYWAGPMGGAFLGALLYDWLFSTNPMGPTRCRARSYDTVQSDDEEKDAMALRRNFDSSPESKI